MTVEFLRKLPMILVLALVAWFAAKFLLPVAMPFLLGLLLARAAEPLVSVLHQRCKAPRPVATAVGVTVTILLLLMVATALGAVLFSQLQRLVGVVPDLGVTASRGLEELRRWLSALAQSAPEGIRVILGRGLENFFSDGTAILEQVTSKLLSLASSFLSRLPDNALGVGTWLVASFLFSAKLPRIRLWVKEKMPPSWQERYLPMLRRMKKSVFGWLFAQLKLMGITFLVLWGGFSLLRISHSAIWALLISFVDVLPILGTGTILVPWSLVCFLQGDTAGGIGLGGIYLTAMLLRSMLEPKLVGKQLGLDPLLTLAVMYGGYRLWGIPGLLLSPLLAVTAVQFVNQQQGE